MRYFPVPILAIVFGLLAGCSTSKWTGTWQASDSPEHGGDLHCRARKVGDGTWKATFSGYCGRQFVYDIEMDGREQDGKVVFAGQVDLGEADGGAYQWEGVMTGNKFDGKYLTASGASGSFQMAPAGQRGDP